jgi:hypothetical protein
VARVEGERILNTVEVTVGHLTFPVPCQPMSSAHRLRGRTAGALHQR